MNRIDTLHIDLCTGNEEFARSFCGGWESFYPQAVSQVIDEVLRHWDTSSVIRAIGSVDLDLGVMSEAEFAREFPLRLRQALDDFMQDYRARGTVQTDPPADHNPQTDFFQAFSHWLLYGTWLWGVPDFLRHPGTLFLEVMQHFSAALRRFLQQYGHYTSVQQRLVWYLDDAALEEGVKLIAPSDATFICSYVRWLRNRYELRRQSGLRQTDHRHTVWLVVYAWLLQEHTSRFQQKTFVMQTLVMLAARYNTAYGVLLRLLTEDIGRFSSRRAVPAGLFPLLGQLLRQHEQAEWKADRRALSRFYRQSSRQLHDNRLHLLSPAGRQALIACLSQPAGCRVFLRELTEPEILRLLEEVAPREASFAGATASLLDRGQKEQMLQGRPGGEFRLLKWQLIFPLLLDRRGRSGWDHRSFLLSLLSGIAAHYNLALTDLLQYLYLHLLPAMEIIRPLRESILRLCQEYGIVAMEQPRDILPDPASLLHDLREGVPGRNFLKKLSPPLLRRLVLTEKFRKWIVTRFTQADQEHLLALLIPSGSGPLLSFLRFLDGLSGYTPLRAKGLREWQQIKWDSFLSVWAGQSTSSSLRYDLFLREWLRELSVRCRIEQGDLLLWLYRQPDLPGLSYPFCRLMRQFLRQEQQRWTRLREGLPVAQEPVDRRTDSLLLPESEYLVTSGSVENAGNREYRRGRSGKPDRLSPGGNKRKDNRTGVKEGTDPGKEMPEPWLSVFRQRGWDVVFFPHGASPDPALYALLRKNELWEWLAPVLDLFVRIYVQTVSVISGCGTGREWSEYLVGLLASGRYSDREEILRSLLRRLWHNRDRAALQRIRDMLSVEFSPRMPVVHEVLHGCLSADIPDPATLSDHSCFIRNAGVVLLSPYLPMLFDRLHLTCSGSFRNREAQIKAAFLIQYVAVGDTAFHEPELSLHKVLTGLSLSDALPPELLLLGPEKETAERMIGAALSHWNKLSHTSVEGFRESFLQREGKLEYLPEHYLLTVESRAYDMLLDTVPWSYHPVRWSWMDKPLQVRWR